MASSRQLFALFAGAVGATITSLPAQPTVSTSTYTYGSVGPASLSSISYSYTYTVTTPTTIWQAPTFPTASPLPACASSSCPSQDKTTCLDADGVEYGLLCNTLFSGDVITSAGKFRGKDKRSYTGTFEGCVEFCDTYSSADCKGVTFQDGYCQAYSLITGSFPNSAGGLAAIRES